MIKQGVVKVLSTTAQEIKLGDDSAFGFDVFTDDPDINWLMGISLADAAPVPMLGGKVYHFPDEEEAGATLMWAKAASGTPNLTVIPHKIT